MFCFFKSLLDVLKFVCFLNDLVSKLVYIGRGANRGGNYRGNYRGNIRRNSGNAGWGDSGWGDNQQNNEANTNGEKEPMVKVSLSFTLYMEVLTKFTNHLAG